MIICEKCFAAEQIKQALKRVGKKGMCPTCGSEDCHTFDTDRIATDLPEMNEWFGDLLSHFSYDKAITEKAQDDEIVLLKTELRKNWNIFSNRLQDKQIDSILKSICKDLYEYDRYLFELPVAFKEKYDPEELEDKSLTHGKSWEQFVEEITKENRFHTQTINLNVLKRILSFMRATIPAKQIYYRCRINDSDRTFIPEEMGPPPIGKATSGRANAPGITCLYLASDPKTAIAEVRAGAYDQVTIGEFCLQQETPVIDFRLIKELCPVGIEMDYTDFAINHEHLIKIDNEMAKGLKNGDHAVDYVATQYITDFVKSIEEKNKDGENKKQYWGIIYNSTLHEKGYNLAIFYKEAFKCISAKPYQVKTVQYSTEPDI